MNASQNKRKEIAPLVERVCARARRFSLDDDDLHVLDLDADEQKVNLADHHVLEVVLGLLVLKLDVQAVFDTNLHLDHRVRVGRLRHVLHGKVERLHHLRAVLAAHSCANEVAQLHVVA